MTTPAAAGPEQTLVRELGVRGLSAHIFNITIGGGIFVLPALVAGGLGAAAPLAYLVCALAMGLILLCFAEAGSRVALTGGPYAYVDTALGPFMGVLAGALLWLVGTFATASVASALAGSLGVLVPSADAPVPRAAILIAVFGALAGVNIRGVRQGTRLIEAVTVAKLVPLLLLILAGAWFVAPERLFPAAAPEGGALLRMSLLLIFAFAGVEAALVPSGEVREPARTVPQALLIAMIAVTLVYIAIQLVVQGILGADLPAHPAAPLAAAAERVAGRSGALLLLVGAAVSMFGFVSGMTLSVPRALYAFARDGALPAILGSVHRRFRTPHIAIVVQSAVVVLLAITGTFARLAIIANVGTLALYLLCCAAAFELRRRDVRAGGTAVRVPFARFAPPLAIAMIIGLLSGAELPELAVVAAVLWLAAAGYVILRWRGRPAGASS